MAGCWEKAVRGRFVWLLGQNEGKEGVWAFGLGREHVVAVGGWGFGVKLEYRRL